MNISTSTSTYQHPRIRIAATHTQCPQAYGPQAMHATPSIRNGPFLEALTRFIDVAITGINISNKSDTNNMKRKQTKMGISSSIPLMLQANGMAH